MYPINMTKKDGETIGFAVANDESEHASLSDLGYEPKLQASNSQTLNDRASALGIKVDSRWSEKTLLAKIAEAETDGEA